MSIRDLDQLEVISEETSLVGGMAFADAYADARARGTYFASTYTNTYTDASSRNYSYWWYSDYSSSACSNSVSQATAD